MIMDKFVRDKNYNLSTIKIIGLKKDLRKKMLLKRVKLSKQAKLKYDQWICDRLLEKIEVLKVKTVHCYLTMGTEININPLIKILLEKGVIVVTPKTFPKRKLKNLILKSLNELEKGVYGTFHPKGDNEYKGEYELIIIPGLAFDAKNYRLGYGGGYYDDFLVNHPLAKKIGIFYPFQEVEHVPLEPHDLKLDEILVNKTFTDC